MRLSTALSSFLLVCAFSASSEAQILPAHLDTAYSYVGTQELGHNAGPEVERFLASVGLPVGNPYCASFISYCLISVEGIELPKIRTALCSRFISAFGMMASEVARGQKTPAPGDIFIMLKGNTIYGHCGFVLTWSGRCGTTIEANTSSGVHGSQSDGDGVWIRERCIQPGNYFRIVGFARHRYYEDWQTLPQPRQVRR